MIQFYLNMIFFGIIIVLSAVVWTIYDWRKSIKKKNIFEKQKDDFLEIISGADQMIDELNKLSGYIVNIIEKSSEELDEKMRNIEQKIEYMKLLAEKGAKVSDGTVTDSNEKEKIDGYNNASQPALVDGCEYKENPDIDSKDNITDIQQHRGNDFNASRLEGKGEKKVLKLNNKSRQVIDMAKNGFDDTEIAKRLNIGKGEIELILGINK